MATKNGVNYQPERRFDVNVSEVEYRKDRDGSWVVLIYQPVGDGPFPAIIDVHGGAWNRGDRANDEVMNRALAASGAVVVALEYRLAPQYPYPAQVADVNYTARWLRANAASFKADPNVIGALGSSSGGHTVMLAGMRPADPRYAALPLAGSKPEDARLDYLLCCWPVLDPYSRYLYTKEVGATRLRESSEAYFLTEEAMREGNPQLILERGEKVELPPTVIIQGTADDNVPMSIPNNFEKAYRAAGGQLQLEVFPNMPHGFGNRPGPESDRAIALMKTFIARQVNKTAAMA